MQNSYKRERKYSSYVLTVRALLLDDTEFVHYMSTDNYIADKNDQQYITSNTCQQLFTKIHYKLVKSRPL